MLGLPRIQEYTLYSFLGLVECMRPSCKDLTKDVARARWRVLSAYVTCGVNTRDKALKFNLGVLLSPLVWSGILNKLLRSEQAGARDLDAIGGTKRQGQGERQGQGQGEPEGTSAQQC
eukprot:6483549-Amphidinium_carterae.1